MRPDFSAVSYDGPSSLGRNAARRPACCSVRGGMYYVEHQVCEQGANLDDQNAHSTCQNTQPESHFGPERRNSKPESERKMENASDGRKNVVFIFGPPLLTAFTTLV